MFIIENMNNYGRFGNQLIYYLNLRKFAKFSNSNWFVPEWSGSQLFNRHGESKNFYEKSVIVNRQQVEQIGIENIINISKEFNVLLRPPLLGEVFFDICSEKAPVEDFLIEKTKVENTAGIHFRGTDFASWNPKAILPSNYYINAIEWICNQPDQPKEYVIFTDDKSLISIKDVITYLDKSNLKWSFSPNFTDENKTCNFMKDFIKLSKSKFIISSPSTFSISAGIISNAKIIHSKEWIDSRNNVNDKFWVELYKGGNACYSIYKLI